MQKIYDVPKSQIYTILSTSSCSHPTWQVLLSALHH